MKLKTVYIKGKDYVPVNERIRAFHELYPTGFITTEIVHQTDTTILMKASAYPEYTNYSAVSRVFTGHAFERSDTGFINKTSHVENCETSAVGRALGFMNIGVETSIATAEEVANAIKQQEEPVCEHKVFTYNGKKYPHVTGIISPDPLPIPSWHLDVGKEVDLYMKAYFTKIPYEVKTKGLCAAAKKNLKECVEACNEWLNKFGPSFEQPILDSKIINHTDLYVGTQDMEGVYENLYSIVDFKKSKNLGKDIMEKYFMQMAAYAKAEHSGGKERHEVEQLVIASPFNDPVVVRDRAIDEYYEKFLVKRAEFKKRFKI